MKTKTCKYCNNDLAVSEFYVRSASPDGLSYKCKTCSSQYNKERYSSVESAAASAKYRAKKWSNENKEKRREICEKYTAKNIESERARKNDYAKQRRIDDPEHCRAIGRIAAFKRRERSAEYRSRPPVNLVKRIIRIAGGTCFYCWNSTEKITIDHFHPVSKGGNGQISNLVPCCQKCNSSKKDKEGPLWVEKTFGLERLVALYWMLERFSSARLP